jgi:hypothetical protein
MKLCQKKRLQKLKKEAEQKTANENKLAHEDCGTDYDIIQHTEAPKTNMIGTDSTDSTATSSSWFGGFFG